MRRLLIALTLGILVSCGNLGAASGQEGGDVGEITTPSFSIRAGSKMMLPLYYATDRLRVMEKGKVTYSTKRRYAAGIEYGVTYATVPLSKDLENLPKDLWQMGWRAKLGKGNGIEVSEPSAFSSPRDFFDEIRANMKKSGREDLVVFVHGYKNSFDSAAASAADIAYWFKYPCVFYSWPCSEKYSGYTFDENNVEWSLQHFRKFIADLEGEVGAEHIYIVAHSMGNRLVNWMLQHRAEAARCEENGRTFKRFRKVILSSPDVDSGTFKNTADLIAKNSIHTYILVSLKDKAIGVGSTHIHGKGRAGMLGPDGLGLGKAGTEGVDTDWRQPPIIKDLDTIEFTELDRGLFGHSIPAPMISGLAKYDKPGPNLELHPEQIGDYKWLKLVRTAK